MDRFEFSRKKSAVVVGVVALAIGLVLDLNMNYFGKFADFVSVILIPLGAVISLGIYFYCIDKNKVIAEINKGSNFKTGSIIVWFGRYIFIPGTVIIIILGLIYGGIG